ncbi:MAG: hypothetical protein FWF49_00910 [Oscillospiraceae bacterium]|nr:hypothetical protein [Oscillospiraceae bacterium]
MAKAGMRRPDPKEPHGTEASLVKNATASDAPSFGQKPKTPDLRWQRFHDPKNDVRPVPQMQGKVKTGKKKAKREGRTR